MSKGGPKALAQGKTQVTCVVGDETLRGVDRIAEELLLSRSQVIARLVESGLESYEMYERWIAKPSTILSLGVALDMFAEKCGLPRPFKTTDAEREHVAKIRAAIVAKRERSKGTGRKGAGK